MTPSKQAAEAAEEIIGQWGHIECLDDPERFIAAIIDARFAGLRDAADKMEANLINALAVVRIQNGNLHEDTNATQRDGEQALSAYAAAKGGAQ